MKSFVVRGVLLALLCLSSMASKCGSSTAPPPASGPFEGTVVEVNNFGRMPGNNPGDPEIEITILYARDKDGGDRIFYVPPGLNLAWRKNEKMNLLRGVKIEVLEVAIDNKMTQLLEKNHPEGPPNPDRPQLKWPYLRTIVKAEVNDLAWP